MRRNLKNLFVLGTLLCGASLYAQEKTVSGTVKDGMGLPVADAVVKTSSGNEVYTDENGSFSIQANKGDYVTIESFGSPTQTFVVGDQNTYSVSLTESDDIELGEAVVTALGITRDKKSLGYSTQQISGETVSATPVANFADALSGEVAGLDIKSSSTMGGSTNMIIRGYSSLTGDNQALVVIDGTPINNKTYNEAGQNSGGGGYDYGNAAADINPNDIESVNILKGAAASALYGSRGANGVIMITTKKGSKKNKGIGVEFNSSLTVGSVDKSTLPKYQNKYGGGYDGSSFIYEDVDGDGIVDPIVYVYDDASFGAAFDPNLMVYNWDSFYPQLPTYLQKSPWVAGKSTPNDIWKTATTYVNSASFSGGNDEGAFRMGITNFLQNGALINSEIKRNTIDFNGEYKLTEKLKASASMTYTNNKGKGRVGTGYEGRNPMQGFRQWWNTAVDMEQQRQAYLLTGQNITWNVKDWQTRSVGYSDNYYFNRYNNFQNDRRDRYFGNVSLNYQATKWLNILGRYTFDNYDELREERVAVGSAGGQGRIDTGGLGEYYFMKHSVSENNYDLILSMNHDINDNINLSGDIGWNLRVNKRFGNSAMTNAGLKVPGLYSITNTLNPLTEANLSQFDINKKVDGLYARASLGLYNTLYLDGSIRRDRSSALPKDNRVYWYPSGSMSFIFSELLDSKNFLSFGKIRANYAEVGNDTDAYNLNTTYVFNPSFNSALLATSPSTLNNPDLKSERMKEFEVGVELTFLRNRIGLDVSYYNRKTIDLITPVDISSASGAAAVWLNSGDMENKGLEATLRVTPVKNDNFQWDIVANFARNRNKVTRIYGDNEYLELGGAWNVSIGAKLGESYGVIRGTDYVYDDNGNRIVGEDGYYLISEDTQSVIGNMVPDWTGGLRNTVRYKNLTLSFLIDVQKGGDVFSFDTSYGYATGLYDFTAGLNELGNPVRNPISAGGGLLLPGVKEDGTPNDIRAAAVDFYNPWGYTMSAERDHVYDASYVKLRNVTFSYDLPQRLIQNTFISKLTLSAIGRNLWIIHKNVPYSDPEAGLAAGNVQGLQNGAHPTYREIGASLKVQF